MKNFRVKFTVFDCYIKGRENWQVLDKDQEIGSTTYLVETDCIETSDWARKGSIAVDNVFIHDDYRVFENCQLFVNINQEWIELKPRV